MLELDRQIAKAISAESPGQVVAETLSAMRAASIKPWAPPSPGVGRRDYAVEGDPPVVIRVHRPADAEGPLPCVYSMHGGGYVLGSYASDDARLDGWSRSYRCVGVSVDYRLAPETPYPGPLDDCYGGLKWVFDHHHELGVDPERIGVAGTSAGSGLAAGLALLARDRGRCRYGTPAVPAYAAPARATDLAGLPPAYICAGNVDGFRDDAIGYASRLNQAGVPAELHVYAGAPHGVKRFTGVRVAQRYSEGINEWLGAQLQASSAQAI